MLYLAFYQGLPDRKDGIWNYIKSIVIDKIIDLFTRGPYSHCELAYPTGNKAENGEMIYRCYTASMRDKGIRVKDMTLDSGHWTLVKLDTFLGKPRHDSVEDLDKFFSQYYGKEYDLLGAIGIITGSTQDNGKWFCSEICSEYLGVPDSWRIHPNLLYSLTKIKGD